MLWQYLQGATDPMLLKKALPVAAPFKASAYGNPGTGKTFTSLLLAEGLAKHRGGRVAFVDTEHGSDKYAMNIPARPVHPDAFDFDVAHTRSMADILAVVKGLDPKVHSVFVLDSISHVWDSAREAYESRNPSANGDIPLRAWASIKRPYKELMRWVVESPLDVILCGRQKSLFEDDDGKLKNVGVGMRAEGETQFEPDICLHFALRGKRGDDAVPVMFVEKDRWGVLSGRSYPKPDFSVLAPLLPFLGQNERHDEDDESRASRDSELLDGGEEKARSKLEKSTGLLADLTAKYGAALDLASLGAVGAEVKKVKRYLVEEHLTVLRELHEQKRDTLAKAVAP